jgi:DUF1365 family protein
VQYFCGGHLRARKQLCQLDFKPNVVKTAVACLDIYFCAAQQQQAAYIYSDNNFSRNRHLYVIVVQLRGNIFIGVDM